MKAYFGIDPGRFGAVVALRDDKIVAWTTLPYLDKSLRTKELALLISQMLQDCSAVRMHVVMEQVLTIKGGGLGAQRTAVENGGRLLGMIELSAWPHSILTPQQWQKQLRLAGAGGDKTGQARKNAIITAYRKRFFELWPDFVMPAVNKDCQTGIVAAALIAKAGYEMRL